MNFRKCVSRVSALVVLSTTLVTAMGVTNVANAQLYTGSGSTGSSLGSSAANFIVSDIQVEGLQRVSMGAVFEILPVQIGDNFNRTTSSKVIRSLYTSGLFQDVSVDQNGSSLIIKVTENPTIASVKFNGNKKFKDEVLDQVMRDNKLAPGDVFQVNLLDKLKTSLKTQYLNEGKYGATVETVTTPLENNRVGINLNIVEGKTATVKKITIIGNKFYSDAQIIKQFESKSKRGLNPFGGSNQYSKEKLIGDIEKLVSLYQNSGFADFELVSSRVSISPKKDGVYLNLNVNEGRRYKVNQFSLNGRLVLPEAELLPLVAIRPGSYYVQRDVEDTVSAISDRLAEEGFSKARVSPVPDYDRQAGTVNFAINVNPGKTIYVRRIEISGNTDTTEEVVRRELRQIEGSQLSPESIRVSKERLKRLGFFEEVDIVSQAVPGQADQVDLEVVVKEVSTGSFSFGLGYSDNDGLILQSSVTQSNFMGTGKGVRFAVDTSGRSDSISLGYTDPYVTKSGIRRSISFSASQIDSSDGLGTTAEYLTENINLDVAYRFPVGENLSWSLGGGAEKVNLETTQFSPPEIVSFIEENPEFTQLKASTRLGYDTRDSSIYTTSGVESQIVAQVAIPGSDLEFYKVEASTDYFLPLTERSSFRLGANVSVGSGYGDTEELPFYENYFAGGVSSVRGYAPRSLGPRDSSENADPIGGDKRVLLSASLLLPVPGSEGKDQRLALFVDGGQVYSTEDNIDLSELRYSAGVGLNWTIPGIGPFSLSYGVPLNSEDGDEEDRVQFSIGSSLK